MKHEDQNIEYKQSWREEYLKWICGFANADGGRMLIGVKDAASYGTCFATRSPRFRAIAIPQRLSVKCAGISGMEGR